MKKYSRLVRKITQTLIGWNVRPFVTNYVIDPKTQDQVAQDVPIADIIERALRSNRPSTCRGLC